MAKKKEEIVISETQTLATSIWNEKEYYERSSQHVRQEWGDCYKAYKLQNDKNVSPFLANLYIPKVHEAVELLSAFLVGSKQNINASPEGKGDTKKAIIVGKYLDFVWRKVLKVRDKLVTAVKQAILFGNGVLKVTWDAEYDEPSVEVVSLTDIYFDYFYRDIQESPSVIHAIRKSTKSIKEDEKYNPKRKNVISTAQDPVKDAEFDTADNAPQEDQGTETTIYERWTKEKVVTIAPTATGWEVIRDIKNPYTNSDGDGIIPFVKIRFKTNPLPNRAYDIGAIQPTLKLQFAFNDAVNQFFDNASLINNKQWIKRRGAKINPADLVRRPGGVITVENIDTDLKGEEVSDIKQSLLELIKLIDEEFQQASMVTNLLKGVPNAQFATEIANAQNNVQTLLDSIADNINDSLSELGHMVLQIVLQNAEKIDSIKVLDNDEMVVFLEGVTAEDLRGDYDIAIQPDRSNLIPKVVKQKQLLDAMNMAIANPLLMQKYPNLPERLFKRWLENGGETDTDYFFETELTQEMNPQMGQAQPTGQGMMTSGQGLTPEANMDSAMGSAMDTGTQI